MLLEGSTQLLDNNSFGAWIFPLLEPQGDAPRHCAQGRQPRYQIAQHPGRDLVADCCERRFKQDVRGQEAFGARALHRQFSHDLRPARSEEHTSELKSLMRTSYYVFC